MTTYTFKPSDFTQSANWSDPSFWVGGVVPNGVDADVVFPVVTYVATGQPYVSTITIQASESYAVHSVVLNDDLVVAGSLSTTGDVVQNDAVDVTGSRSVAITSRTAISTWPGRSLQAR